MRRHVPTSGKRMYRIQPTGRVGMIPANHALPKLKSSRTGHDALSPRRRSRAARAGNGGAPVATLWREATFPPVRKDPTCRRQLQGCTERPTGTALHPTPPSPGLVAIGWKGMAERRKFHNIISLKESAGIPFLNGVFFYVQILRTK